MGVISELTQALSPETKSDTLKAFAGTGVGTGGTLFTMDLFIAMLTAVYLLGSIGLLVPKYIREYQAWKDKKARE